MGNGADRPNLEILLSRAKKAVQQRGKKKELSVFMNVAPPRISEWLSGQKEPRGEHTLQLLQWVENQERQQIAPLIAQTSKPVPIHAII